MDRVTYTSKRIRPEETGSEYDEQANKWLEDTDSTLEIEHVRTGKYFPDDEKERDIYKVTLRKGAGVPYTFEFGQSLAASGVPFAPWKPETIHERETRMERERKARRQPSAYSILACLEKYSPGTFETFCADMGMDTDSIKAHKTWEACVNQWFELSSRYTEAELEQLQEIA